MALRTSMRRPFRRQANIGTVQRCYALFDRFFPACGLFDYTEGLYHGDSRIPYEQAQQNQLNYVLDQVRCTAHMRLLEIGCGNGTLLELARNRGADAVGITICPEQVARCRRRGLDVRLLNYLDLDDAWTRQFDAVVANGPVEHFVQPSDAVAGRADEIYREFFGICRRAINPNSAVRRLVTTTIHFARVPDPRNLLRSPLAFRRGTDNLHWAMLARSFGGWYPVCGQFQRCAAGLFQNIHTTDGTYDYHLTSEEWLRRMQAALPTAKGLKLLAGALPYAICHPVQFATMLACLLGTQSWNWQFRGPDPPTRLIRQTWAYA